MEFKNINLNNLNNSEDEYLTDTYEENSYITDSEDEIYYEKCSICKKKFKWGDDCFLVEEDEKTGEIIFPICCYCKENNMKCKNCDEDLSSDDIYTEQIKYLLINFGKIERCINCMVTTGLFILKPNKIEDLEVRKNKNESIILDEYEYKSKYEELTKKNNELLEISNFKNIDEIINMFSKLKEENNQQFEYNDVIYKIINKKNKDQYKNKPQQNQNDEYFIKYKHNIYDYKLKKLLSKNKKIKNNIFPKYQNNKINIHELNSLHINITESYINILDDLDLLEEKIKEIENVLPVFNKLKSNIDIIYTEADNDNEMYRLFSNLNKNKINEYNTMCCIGENIIKNNLKDDYINKYIKFFKNRKGRFILKCKRIFILSKYINIEVIALSGISHFIRDSNINTFNCLLDLLKLDTKRIDTLFI